MRLAFFAVLVCAACPIAAIADDAADLETAKASIAAAHISAASDLSMWCGAAMTLVAAATKDTDADKSSAADAAATTFFGEAATSLKADGVKDEDLAALSGAYMTVANAQLVAQTESPSHSTDDCVTN
jgi:hypothetical protein